MVMAYGVNACRYVPMWYFPQIIIYAFVYGFCIVYITENLQKKKKSVILFMTLLMFAGCFLEAYINPVCLSYVFS